MAVPTDKELKSLLEKFVCVRIVQMHGIDLKRFAFDGSLTWAVFMMNADGTIYGRYGSRSGLKQFSDREISVAGFKKSLSGALELHAQYGADKLKVGKQLAGKTRADKPSWPTPEAIPSLQATPRLVKRFIGAKGQHGGCIHCHMVPANEIKSMWLAKREIHDRELVPYPMPNQLGFRMDPKQAATVQRTWPNSRADRAGLKVGDRILRIDQQPILSTADIQWLLHNAENQDSLAIEVERGDERNNTYPVDLQILAYDRQGLLRDISQVMADQNLNVIAVNTQSDADDQTARMALTVELYDVEQLSRTMDKLRQLPNVLQVERRN